LESSWELISSRSEKSNHDDKYKDIASEEEDLFEETIKTLEFLKELCEGHNKGAQDILRIQTNGVNFNVVEYVAKMLVEQALHSNLSVMQTIEVKCLTENMEVLSEFVQGPCLENQQTLIEIDGFVATLERLLRFDKNEKEVTLLTEFEMKSSALTLLVSLFEGRSDDIIHSAIAEECVPLTFAELYKRCYDEDYGSDYSRVQGEIEDRKDENAATRMFDLFGGISASLNTLIVVLRQKVPSFADKLNSGLDDSNFDEIDPHDAQIQQMLNGLENGVRLKWLDDKKLRIGSVEVDRKSRIELVSFPIPKETRYLSAETRKQFLDSIDMTNCDSRVKV